MRLCSSFKMLLLGAMVSAVSGHFTLDYPQTRGFDEDTEDDNFCGGFHNVSAQRAPWYYRNGPVQIDSHHDSATVNIYISFEPPTSSESFLHTSSGASLPTLRNDLALVGQGEFCFHANASNLDVAGVDIHEGTNATIMVEFINNVHGHLYQCSDVTFTSNATIGSNLQCTDALTASVSNNSNNEDDNDEDGDSDSKTSSSSTVGGPEPTSSNISGSQGNGAESYSASYASVKLLGFTVLVAFTSLFIV